MSGISRTNSGDLSLYSSLGGRSGASSSSALSSTRSAQALPGLISSGKGDTVSTGPLSPPPVVDISPKAIFY